MEGYARMFSLLLPSDRSVRGRNRRSGSRVEVFPAAGARSGGGSLEVRGRKFMTRMKSHDLRGCGDRPGPSPKNVRE